MDKDTFTSQYGEVANKVAAELGVPPQGVLAQWGLETGWGKSIIPSTNNLGNIKGKLGGGVEATDNATGSRDPYNRYDNVDAFASDYVGLIKRRYPKALNQPTVQGFASALKAGGYAEDKDYVKKVMQSAGEKFDLSQPVPPLVPEVAQPTRAMIMDKLIADGVQRAIAKPEHEVDFFAAVRADEQLANIRAEAEPSLWESWGAAAAGATTQTLIRGVKSMLTRDKFEPEPGYTFDMKTLPIGYDYNLAMDLTKSRSAQESQHILSAFEEEQFRVKTMMANGVGKGMLMSFAAEGVDATNIVVPLAVSARLTRAGLAAHQVGSKSAAIGSAIAENVLSGTAIEATRQLVTGHYSGADLAVSVAIDGLLGVGVGHFVARAHGERLLAASATEAEARASAYVQKAQANLGASATPEMLAVEAARLRQAEAGEILTAATAPRSDRPFDVDSPAVQADAVTPPKVQLDEPAAAFDTQAAFVLREEEFAPGGKHAAAIADYTKGLAKTVDDLHALPPGVHFAGGAIPDSRKAAVDTVIKLARKFLPDDYRIVVSDKQVEMPGKPGVFANGSAVQVSGKAAIITIDPNLGADALRTAVHESGHLIFNHHIAKVAPDQRVALVNAFNRFLETAKAGTPDGNAARAQRYSLTNAALFPEKELTTPLKSKYELDWDEFSAEQFVKYVEENSVTGNSLGLHREAVALFKYAIQKALEFLRLAKRQNVGVTNEYKALFDTLANSPEVVAARPQLKLAKPTPAVQADAPAEVVESVLTDPFAQQIGVNLAPMGTKSQRDEAKAIAALHRLAIEKAPPLTPELIARADNLADNEVFNVASAGLLMLKSKSPLLRWVASVVAEDASGVKGKVTPTAAISKHIIEREIQQNVVNEVENAYELWAVNRAGSVWDDHITGTRRAAFHKELSTEIEARRVSGKPVSADPNISAAVDSIEAAYTRSAKFQVDTKTLGYEALPKSSVGYMPHRMSSNSLLNLSNEKKAIVHQAIVDQVITNHGWDASFADNFASKYMQRVMDRASGGYSAPMGGHSAETADLAEEVLHGMNLPQEEVDKYMKQFRTGGATQTKTRTELDLNREYPTADGTTFRLMDIFETDQIELLRQQAQRVSGEVALAQVGIMGTPAVNRLRAALQYGLDGQLPTPREREAFDQLFAEMMGTPYGQEGGKWMDRTMAANRLIRLGGIAWTQASETFNGVIHLGVASVMSSIASMPRMRQEIRDLVAGKAVNNPFLTSLETGGATFGTDSYKMAMPFDSPNHAYPTYGKDTLTMTDRLLRGGGHLQAKLSGHRLLHSVQQRGMSEQIVKKMLRYIRDGGDDIALDQMGITADMRLALRAELPTIAKFDASGSPAGFEAHKISDPELRKAVIQAVWRGTNQIIQGTFVGERGKWAHDGWLKLLTEFRSFSIVSMEKQWGRQRNSHGKFKAYGMAMGLMSMAIPIHYARVYAASIGREDQEAFIEKRTDSYHTARAVMGYAAMLGVAPDMVDFLTAVAPEALTGPQPPAGRDAVGGMLLPSASTVNDIYKAMQDPTDPNKALRALPMGNLPYLVPFFNTAR